jgi:hypothetical protein
MNQLQAIKFKPTLRLSALWSSAVMVFSAMVLLFGSVPTTHAIQFTTWAEQFDWNPYTNAQTVHDDKARNNWTVKLIAGATGVRDLTSETLTFQPGTLYSVVVRARGGIQCGDNPKLAVTLDGNSLGIKSIMTGNTYTDYHFAAPANTPGGTHKVAVSYVNQFAGWLCTRTVFIDEIGLDNSNF